MKPLPRAIAAKIINARIARLATVDAKLRPHIVPVCFVFDGLSFYTALDGKPKRVAPERLARVRNIRSSPQVALIVDQYGEDWTQLWFILVRGKANLLSKSARHQRAQAIRQLRAKYPQYSAGMLPDDAPIIRIVPWRVTSWGKL